MANYIQQLINNLTAVVKHDLFTMHVEKRLVKGNLLALSVLVAVMKANYC